MIDAICSECGDELVWELQDTVIIGDKAIMSERHQTCQGCGEYTECIGYFPHHGSQKYIKVYDHVVPEDIE